MTLGLRTDPLIREMLSAALTLRREFVAGCNDEQWAREEESRVFPRQLAVAELVKLEHANRLHEQFDLQDYHAMLVYFALQLWVDEHNNQVLDRDVAGAVGPFEVGLIDFAAVIERLIWDEDFLVPSHLVNAPEVKAALGLGPAAWSIANGLTVHPEELELVARPEHCSWDDRIWHYVPGHRFPADCRSLDSADDCGSECYWNSRLG
ncbi:MAG: hypothetical protein ACJA0V_004380 [Planctomycetota bacterium]|jgi:hypothetical protein